MYLKKMFLDQQLGMLLAKTKKDKIIELVLLMGLYTSRLQMNRVEDYL
jgi:hypothetical protein